MSTELELRLERELAASAVAQARIALEHATPIYERALRAYREAEYNLSQAHLHEAEVLDRQAIAGQAATVWLMETTYQRRTSVPRAWHAYDPATLTPGQQGGPATALCGATILNDRSAHREPTLAGLESSFRRASWRRICSRCRSLAPAR